MKVIISHDIDHMTVWEHLFKDLILPKFVIRANIELFNGKIGLAEYSCRISDFLKNKWQRIDEVMDFNDKMGIKSAFFIGVNNGVGLSYSLKHVEKWAPKILKRGYEVGVHGISFDNYEAIKMEFDIFKEITKMSDFGIRMHYLRKNDETLDFIEKAGYLYDATPQGFENPYKHNKMWVFPLQIMDGWIVNGEKRYQSRTLEEAKQETLKQIGKAKKLELSYLSILFHDRYMSDSFLTWKKWYEWLIRYLKNEGYEFVLHKEAINSLERLKKQ
ncbi:MAG: hypothetical protein CMC96_12945 [Flavobacteriales bacterium]|nr:hypothetical protein [Flavobacteriales bacterium]|tara:strand:- start:22141 stop:22959 length:819 start_codon:yes stop_codon:yes gene_type:complete